MAAVVTGTVTASSPVNGVVTLLYTDTGTGYGTIVSRTLNIYDSDDELLDTISMGASLTAEYDITVDQYLSFVEVLIDNTGIYQGTVNYLSTTFYYTSYVNAVAQLGCSCNCGSETLTYIDIAQMYLTAAERYALAGLAPASQSSIVAANYFITGNV